jgi:hypothetical protein
MGDAKSHHYVPQFYLRRFSDDGRSIRLLNKSSNRIIEGAPIKGQCAVDNFHGWHDEVEGALSGIESASAASIDRVLRSCELPVRNSEDYLSLLVFIALQSGRTRQQAVINNKYTDFFYKEILKGRADLKGFDLDKVVIEDRYPVALPLVTSMKAFHFLETLESTLLLAGDRIGFVTSDDPVVLYNSGRASVWWEGVTGLDSAGLQVFLPLSRGACLYLYDPAVYVTATNTSSRKVCVADVLKLNALTILNSDRNIFGHTRSDLDFAQCLRELTKPLENYPRIAFVETESYEDADGKQASIMANYRLHPPASFEFRFAHRRRGALLDGIRSDRMASLRRKQMPDMPGTHQLAVASSTLDGPRIQLNDNDVMRLAHRSA